jgi:hypothetical protein
MKQERPALVACPRCSLVHEVSARQGRRVRKGEHPGPLCVRCKQDTMKPIPEIEPKETLSSWWTNRYTMEQIRELAGGLE